MHDASKNSISKMTQSRTNHLLETDDCHACLQQARFVISDSKDRLVYVIQQTTHAADCVLYAVENAQPLQDELAVHAQKLLTQWQQLLESSPVKHASQQALQVALTQTIDFLSEIPKKSGLTRQHLTEVLLAQSHQDLTGQVTQKLLQTFETLEQQLQQLPIKKSVSTKTGATKQATGLTNGPVIDHTKQPDTLASQNQVDSLLAKLGL